MVESLSGKKSLRLRALGGLKWSAATQVVLQVIRFGITIVLTRFLNPAEFGMVAMLSAITGFARLFADLGFGAAIVRTKDLKPEHLDAVFWLNVSVGASLTVLFLLLAPAVASFYQEPQLTGLTVLTSFGFLFGSLNVVQGAVLQRSLSFRTLFFRESIALLVSGIVAVGLARRGAGAYSLVWQSLIASIVSAGLMWRLSSWQPRFRFQKCALNELFGFGGNLFLSNLINYWARNFDALAIGKFLGSSEAGLYTRAFQLMMLPVSQLTTVLGRVMFPALAQIQDDTAKVSRVYLRATRIMGLVAFPFMLILMVLARPAILTVYGPRWAEAVPIFQVLCWASLSHSIGSTLGWLYMTQGRADIQRNVAIYTAVLRVIGFFCGIRWGIFGVAVSYVVTGYLLIWYPVWSTAGRLVGLSFGAMTANLASPFFCASAAALTVAGVDRFGLSDLPNPARLMVGFGIGAIVYGALVCSLRLQAWRDLCSLLPRRSHLNFAGSAT